MLPEAQNHNSPHKPVAVVERPPDQRVRVHVVGQPAVVHVRHPQAALQHVELASVVHVVLAVAERLQFLARDFPREVRVVVALQDEVFWPDGSEAAELCVQHLLPLSLAVGVHEDDLDLLSDRLQGQRESVFLAKVKYAFLLRLLLFLVFWCLWVLLVLRVLRIF